MNNSFSLPSHLLLASLLLAVSAREVSAQFAGPISLSIAANGTRQVSFTTDTNYYYCLCRGDIVTNVNQPISLSLGDGSLQHLDDSSAQNDCGFYRVRAVARQDSLDLDGDGMTDLFELTYGFNPLDASDASGDPDQDGYTNLQESQLGTNPLVPNSFAGGGGLVINEIDYDNLGTDTTEFVEILNTSTSDISLNGVVLVLLNGAVSPAPEYLRVSLSSAALVLHPGQYLVACAPAVIVPATALRINFSLTSNAIQNGAPDGLALINTITGQVIDALSYEGAITSAQITGFSSAISLVEGTFLPANVADSNSVQGSLIRWPNGTDSNDAASDWIFTSTPTPGTANARN